MAVIDDTFWFDKSKHMNDPWKTGPFLYHFLRLYVLHKGVPALGQLSLWTNKNIHEQVQTQRSAARKIKSWKKRFGSQLYIGKNNIPGAISIQQPWVFAICKGLKPYENRKGPFFKLHTDSLKYTHPIRPMNTSCRWCPSDGTECTNENHVSKKKYKNKKSVRKRASNVTSKSNNVNSSIISYSNGRKSNKRYIQKVTTTTTTITTIRSKSKQPSSKSHSKNHSNNKRNKRLAKSKKTQKKDKSSSETKRKPVSRKVKKKVSNSSTGKIITTTTRNKKLKKPLQQNPTQHISSNDVSSDDSSDDSSDESSDWDITDSSDDSNDDENFFDRGENEKSHNETLVKEQKHYDALDAYIIDTFYLFCQTKTQIILNLPELSKVKNLDSIGMIHSVKQQKYQTIERNNNNLFKIEIFKLFENLQEIIIYSSGKKHVYAFDMRSLFKMLSNASLPKSFKGVTVKDPHNKWFTAAGFKMSKIQKKFGQYKFATSMQKIKIQSKTNEKLNQHWLKIRTSVEEYNVQKSNIKNYANALHNVKTSKSKEPLSSKNRKNNNKLRENSLVTFENYAITSLFKRRLSAR
eukprot:382674_1